MLIIVIKNAESNWELNSKQIYANLKWSITCCACI